MQTVIVLLLLLLSSAAGSSAQVVPRDTTAPLLIPGLTVTVLSTPIEVVRAPYAVAVNTQHEIQLARPGLGLDEALRGIPGVQVDNRYNYALGERISIRGFGARAQFGVRGIKVIVDGVPATFPDGQTSLSHVDMGFLSRAEVLRGPASALYGASAGGVVQLETEEPPFGRLSQEIGLTTGSDGLLRLQSTTGGRGGRGQYLLNVSRLEYDGYRTHNEAENTHVDARYNYLGEVNQLRFSISAVDYDAQNPGSLSEALLASNRYEAFANNVRFQTGETGQQAQAGLTWKRDLGPGAFESTLYGITRSVDNPIPNTVVVLDRKVVGARALFRAGGPMLEWSAGVEGAVDRDDRQNYVNVAGEHGDLTVDQNEAVDNLAGFVQVNATPLPRLTLLGGLRYDWYNFSADDNLVTATNPDDSGERSMSDLSPSIGLSFAASDALNLYGNVASSFETPTTTELANRLSGAGGFNPDLDPQQAVSYEVGAKGTLGRWARYDLGLYHTDVTNGLIPFEVPGAPGRSFFRNAGSATHRGIEASAIFSPIELLQLRGSYTYTDAVFDDYATASSDFSGNQVPGVAPHRTELSATLHAPSGVFAAIEGRHTSRLPVNDGNTAYSPDSDVVDARIGLERVSIGGFEFAPYAGITNLFDEKYNTSVVVNAFGGRFFEPGPGRSFYIGLNTRLGLD